MPVTNHNAKVAAALRSYPDMLEVGVTAPQPPGALHHCASNGDPCQLNSVEWQTHFSAWAINSAPLILGMDLRDFAAVDAVWPVIANPEVLRVRHLLPSPSFRHLLLSSLNATF